MINTIIWNCSGIGNSPTVNHLNNLVTTHKASLIAVLEPMVDVSKAEEIKRKLNMDSIWVNLDAEAKIWVLWNSSISIQHISDTSQSSTFLVTSSTTKLAYYSFVYGSNDRLLRRDLWVDLINFSANLTMPWVVGGDFNAVCDTTEVIASSEFDFHTAHEFNEFKHLAGIVDLDHKGNFMSWSNNW